MTSPQQVASHAEEILDESMNGQESLRLTWRFELSHLSFSLPRRLVRDFGAIVLVLLGAMADGRHDAPMRRRIASQLVGDQPTRHAALTFQQLAEKPFGGPVATRLDEDVDDVAILIDGTREILPLSLDRDEDLVQVPCVSLATLAALQSTSVFRPELDAPKTDGFKEHSTRAYSTESTSNPLLQLPRATRLWQSRRSVGPSVLAGAMSKREP